MCSRFVAALSPEPQAGALEWYQHLGRSAGTPRWVDGSSPRTVGGSGWQNFRFLFAGEEGVIYGVRDDGKLEWYRLDRAPDGTLRWANGGNAVVVGNSGWDRFKFLFWGGDGVIYGVRESGELQWHKHLGWRSGTTEWVDGSTSKTVGSSGWQNFKFLFSGGDGVIYGARASGELQWHKHLGWRTGAPEWVDGSTSRTVGATGWQNFLFLFSGGDGVIYGVRSSGELQWHRHVGWRSGNREWVDGSTSRVVAATGWDRFKFLFAGDDGALFGVRSS